ncbi:sulfotransferase family protein [Salipiger aestuarii]|uniref:sulfotransferase family protein n=1 Tax=Salipiger aestuarii TaxID=568098 RepID=UPI00123A294D|nr:sulfotransferase [Salipiger aestuarii]
MADGADKTTPPLPQPALEALETLLAGDGAEAARDAVRDLLAQCAAARPEPTPLRCIHHFACSGGTLISKAIASVPNAVVMSEIDPLSTLHLRQPRQPFLPTDLIASLRYSPREIGQDTIVAVFFAGLQALARDLSQKGLHLVLRDHAHSQYCTAVDRFARPTLNELLTQLAGEHNPPLWSVRGVVTVRHPLESYMSVQRNGWFHFSPSTLEEYSTRYRDFLRQHQHLPIVKYEDFVANPDAATRQICDHLELPFEPHYQTLMPLARLSGDSGRRSAVIAPRARRAVGPELQQQVEQSRSYRKLCERLGYNP